MTIHVLNFRDARRYKVDHIINPTSRSDDWSRALSPFILGPVKMYRPFTCFNVENGWQYTKLYPEHADKNGDPTDAYWEWAKKGWSSSQPHRYPMGKGRKPLCSVWMGKKLDYIEARKRIYIPLYAKAARRTWAWEHLQELHASSRSITLLDFDAYDHIREGLTYEDVMNNPNRKMGHSFVLAMMLDGLV